METSSKSQPSLNLVIFDSVDLAGDNGEYFYMYVKESYPNVKLTFLLSKKSKDWGRLLKDGFNLYDMESSGINKILSNATYILWSKNATYNIFHLLANYRYKSIFLGHGVTALIYNDDFYFRSTISRLSAFVCTTSEQESNVVTNYSKGRSIPLLVGFPRHDFLLKRCEDRTNKVKQMFISFHWRMGKLDRSTSTFKTSSYLKRINELLNSNKLKKFVDDGGKVVFFPHARFRKYINLFKIPKYIDIPVNSTFQDILSSSDLLVTDFSSNTFEFAYMDKPTIVYVPDPDYVKKHMPHYHMENICKYSHLCRCNTVDDVICKMNDFLYTDTTFNFSKNTFKFHDTNNSKRLMTWMITQLQSKSKSRQANSSSKCHTDTNTCETKFHFG